ncbi:mycothione reductase [Nocardioides sp. Soil796]|uniref:mycothione reductase n=1 Tax=Nocardioides sp. Soil796 TaxID=1736412 RepID=UPI00070C5F3D|nr:mycothione reductase [Nocardioides sp. Soil796]KRF15717.1 mycothione reductase [Nocardioides sp. Soil796]
MARYDIAVIGAGSGNFLANRSLRDKQFAIIEENLFGGTCLNVGCIPTKMFVHTADVANWIRDAGRFGIDASLDGVRWADIRDRIFGRIDPNSAEARQGRVDGANTTVLEGHATFTGDRTLAVDLGDHVEEVTADQVVIAAGGRPVIPTEIAESGVPFETSDTIMRIETLPRTLTIVGGGFIAAEFAHIFSALGVEVTLVVRGDALVRRTDAEISAGFTELATKQWNVHLGRTVTTASVDDGGLRLGLDDGTTLEAEMLLVATGRRPNSDRLDLAGTGIELHDDGRIVVDEFGRTTSPGVWALGDISSPHQLKHVANHEARTIAHNLAHPDELRPFDHRFVPSAIFSHPQMAGVGLTEAEALDAGHRVSTSVRAYGDTAYGWAMEDTTGICKVIADRDTGLLLGAHIMGPDASTLIQPAIQALSFGLGARDMARGQYWIHPAMAEVLENALLGLDLR